MLEKMTLFLNLIDFGPFHYDMVFADEDVHSRPYSLIVSNWDIVSLFSSFM